jgi:Ca2+-transporting ATPase
MMVPESPHALPVAELLRQLRVSSAEGLSDDEVNARRKRFGLNTITSRRATSAMRLLLHQFGSPIVYLFCHRHGTRH